MPSNSVDQGNAQAEGDIVGRDKITNVHMLKNPRVKELVEQLSKEMDADDTRLEWIESLTFFEEPFAPDGVIGLEAKLVKCGRPDKIMMAMRAKKSCS